MKAVVVPNNVTKIEEYIKGGAQAFIFGLKDFSVGYQYPINIETIKNLVEQYKEIEFFISMNKNIFNHELKQLKEVLKELDTINIKGVLFYDLSLIQIKKQLNLKLDLVWNQNYMVTNYNTCDYYYQKEVRYGILSQEITLEEMLEIKDKTKMTLMAYVLYHPLMSHTRRKLLTNYFLSMNQSFDGRDYILKEKDNEYIIKEEEPGDTIYHKKIVNGYKAFLQLEEKLDYIIFSQDYMDDESFIKAFSCFFRKDEKKLEELIGDYTGFFYIRTIYKVR